MERNSQRKGVNKRSQEKESKKESPRKGVNKESPRKSPKTTQKVSFKKEKFLDPGQVDSWSRFLKDFKIEKTEKQIKGAPPS